ncbi:glycosyltransferase [Streptomonospora nanhaiensis]|uniref:glycosyltransferase n=1 Tax=Streptomonospora nanhaiensis TaxID=1323731 RepID=UPI001C9A0AEE|nr:glycosyltransferase [Streptomonospora nanhaiensis]MBX9390162.1 glycosyltransferase [Streptomonospora nanhaiensis]
MARFLFLLHVGGPYDGGVITNIRLTESLAAQGHEVTVLCPEPTVEHKGVRVVELTPDRLPAEVAAGIAALEPPVNRFSPAIVEHFRDRSPADLGLPEGEDAFDAIVGYADMTGPAAAELRDRFYRSAKVVNHITFDPLPVLRAAGNEELGLHRAQRHAVSFAAADLVLGQGPKAAADARRLMTGARGAAMLPPTHQYIPGMAVSRAAHTPPRAGEPLRLLMLGRTADPNKGAAEVAAALRLMHAMGYREVHLTLMGVQEGERAEVEEAMRLHYGPSWEAAIEVKDFTTDRREVERAIAESHVLVVATRNESLGLVSAEYAAVGKPLVIAPGDGNGFAAFLQDTARVPRALGAYAVVDDSGSTDLSGAVMGAAPPTGAMRHEVIAERLMAVADNYPAYLGASLRVRDVLAHYTSEHAALSVADAVERLRAGDLRHTKQGADAAVLAVSEAEILTGVPVDRRGRALLLSPGRPAADAPDAADPALGAARGVRAGLGRRRKVSLVKPERRAPSNRPPGRRPGQGAG